MDLTDRTVTPHRESLSISEPSIKGVSQSEAQLNYEFIQGPMKDAINDNKFTVRENRAVSFKYLVGGITCTGELQGFVPSNPLDYAKQLDKELHRVYDRLHDIHEQAYGAGVTLSGEAHEGGPQQVEKIQQAEVKRKNLSVVNPMMRAKKVQKGFGGK